MNKNIYFKALVLVAYILFSLQSFCQTKISVSSGNWGSASTWSPSGVPTATNNVIIANGHILDLNVNVVCNSLIIGQGLAAVLAFNNGPGGAKTVSITTNLTINNAATFSVQTNSNKTHTLVINGNIVNNGVLNFATDLNSVCSAIFSRNGNQTVSGTGATTRFSKIIVNLGTVITNTLEFTTTNFATAIDFLTITNGTFKLSTLNATTVNAYSVAATIPSTGRIFLNSATAIITASANVNLNGNITVAAGTLNIGNAANEDLLTSGGTLSQSGGVINVAGKYNTLGAASTFSIGGGTLNINTAGSTNTTIAPFHISIPGSSFNMTGGQINILREGGMGAENLGFLNTGATAGTVTGGTLQIGTATTPTAQIMNINTISSVGNLNVGSANATASLTNVLNVIGNVTISSGTLNANNLNLTLGGNWSNNGGTYTPGTNTTIFNSATAQSIFKTGGETFNNLTFSGPGIKTFSSAVISNSNVLINTGASVDVSAVNHQLTLAGNYTNNGAVNTRSGTVLFNGITAQTIGGASITNFYNLTINKTSGGVSLLSAQNLINTLTLNNGIFSINSQAFTMVSTATNTARIAQITGTGDISGNVIVQRFAPGGSTGWALFGTPISSALTLNDWDDDIAISCLSCPDGYVAGFPSIYTYDETQPGTHDTAAAYIPLSTINDFIIPNKGYWVYLGTSSSTTTPITLDVTGSVRKFNNTIPLNYTNYGSAIDDGWNLIHNPYPSPIRWSLLMGATANIDNAIYVYNADLNGGTGAYATYINNISSPAVGSGGIGDDIPMCQGFYVHSTGATALTAQESNKGSGNPAFLKMQTVSSAASSGPLLRLHLKNATGYNDETVLYFETGATDFFDADYDAYKLPGQDVNAPVIALQKTDLFQVNGIAPIVGNFTMPLKTTTGYAGTYTISTSNINSFPTGACITLYDKLLGITTDLKTSDYVFNLSSSTTTARFDLNISINPLNINSTTNQPSCPLPNSGEITAIGVSAGPWNYFWKNSVGTIIKTSLAKASADTLNNLSGSTYTVEVNTVGMCDHNITGFAINAVTLPTPAFISQDTTDLSLGALVNFTNTSINSSSDYWDFGDGIGFSTANSPNYNYLSSGTFVATLISTSSTGCNDTITKAIVVINSISAGIQSYENSTVLLVRTLNDNDYLIQQKLTGVTDLNFKLFDGIGRLIMDYGDLKSDKINLSVNLKNYSQGIYFLNIIANGELKTIKFSVK